MTWCWEVNGSICGLCFENYVMTLQERAKFGPPLDTKLCFEGGISHLHGLDLIHNDINLRNIMMDADDNLVIIDFDSCRRGEKKSSRTQHRTGL